MPIRLYNTLTKTKDVFTPLDPKNVRMYVCGPTVYDFAHIGNARPAIVFDVLFRLLRHEYEKDGGKVTYVRNITDVDDKINARAAEERISIRDLTERTAEQYRNDVAALGCLDPTYQPRATDHIEEMKEIIERLCSDNHAYVANEHVLFDVSSMREYGELSKRPLDEMIAGARVDVAPYKKNPMDFVLWKPTNSRSNIPLPSWKSPRHIEVSGRPGWHIECSAMAWKYLKETFDIHGGGIDLIFPHHENEIAQSRCAFHTGFMAKYWMHNGFLQVEGEKMAKSAGNFFTIRDLLNKYPGGALRFAMLQTHYRQPINWTQQKVEDAWSELQDWAGMLYGSHAEHKMHLRVAQKQVPQPHPSVLEALSDDLNTSDAIMALRKLFKKNGDPDAYATLVESCEFLGLFDHRTIGAYFRGVSGMNLGYETTFRVHADVQALKVAIINRDDVKVFQISQKLKSEGVAITRSHDGDVNIQPLTTGRDEEDKIRRLIEQRDLARAAKNFAESDRIRDDLLAKGIVLKDGPGGTTWEVKR